jgi:uncharacterized protein (TIGR02594 family)
MSAAKWLNVARTFLNVAETKGPQHNPKIMALLDIADGKKDGKNLGGIRDDETPWCASYVSGVLETAGIKSARTAWARGHLKWGVKLDGPAIGAIVVLERGPTSGHVGFVVGKDAAGHVMIHGGNQGDAVNEKPFVIGRVLGYRWPEGEPLPVRVGMATLPVYRAGGPLSTNEA